MRTAKLFKNGESQAVRLPKEFRFEGTEVLIKRVGDAVVLLPTSRSWDTLVESIQQQIFSLPDETRLLSGHGPETTVGKEKSTNPFVGL